jgi:hypothetical protein
MHRKGLLAAALAAAALLAAPPQKKKPRPPDVEVVKISSLRQEGRIAYEGTLKVTGETPVAGLVLHLSFYESRGVLLSMQKIQLETAQLAPGQERQFDVQGKDVPRAVSFRVSATDGAGRDLNVAGAGPYPLD